MKLAVAILSISFAVGSAIPFANAADDEPPKPKPQYQHGDISIPAASADEPKRAEFSLQAAADHLEQASLAWARDNQCVSCHTPGTYLQVMPELTPLLGPPPEEMRTFFVDELADLKAADSKKFTKGTSTAQAVYIAAGLAEWDRHVAGEKLSAETDAALRLVFRLQQENGTWQSLDCWPPFESSAYQEATVVAMAAATAPGWLEEKAAIDAELGDRVGKLVRYLKDTTPAHDYARVLQLWTASRAPGFELIDDVTRDEIVSLIRERQHDDGGWSMRDFGEPEQWGRGNRAKKLRAEPDFESPPSDGHMTGLCVLVLREAGISADDPQLKKAVEWLLANQRESGRWWTRSLNTDKSHFITYSGTAYPLLALARCGVLK